MCDRKLCPEEKHGCGKTKPLTEFHKNPHNKDGTAHICGECTNRRNREQKEERERSKEDQEKIDRLFYKFCGVGSPTVALMMVKREREKSGKGKKTNSPQLNTQLRLPFDYLD